MGRDRNQQGRYADRIPPEDVLEVFDGREDLARPITAGDVTEALGIARRTAHNKLHELVERGALETRKVGARGRVWWVPLPREGDVPPSAADMAPRARETRHAGADAAETTEGTTQSSTPTTSDSRPLSGSPPDDTPERLEDVDFPGSKDRKACEAAVFAARDYIHEHGGATMRELVAAVMPEHPIGYEIPELQEGERYRGSWWRRVVKPGLEALEDVEKPPRGGSTWRVA